MAEKDFDDLVKKLPEIAKAVNAFTSESVQQKAFEALVASFRGTTAPSGLGEGAGTGSGDAKRRRVRKRRAEAGADGSDNKPQRKPRRAGPSIVRDLNLRPKDHQSFKDFATAKKPVTAYERNTVAVYWLRSMGVHAINQDHVYTCYKEMSWRLPGNLYHSLANTAFKKGWLDTSDMNDIKLGSHGENLVDHDLPHKAKE